MSQKLRITSETILSISAIFIAFISIFISIWDGVETRKHNRLSVRPKLDMSYNLNKGNFGYITNNGLGPAIITDMRIFIDGHEINYAGFTGFDDFLDNLGLTGRLLSRSSLGAGTTMKSGSSEAIIILKLFATDSAETLIKKVYQRVSIELSYASMYEESFKCKIPSNEN